MSFVHLQDYWFCFKKVPQNSNSISPKSGPFRGVFWMSQNEFSRQKCVFLKTKKADQKHCENWRCESGSELHKTSPTCDRGEGRKQLRDFFTQSLKQTPLGSGIIPFQAFLVQWLRRVRRIERLFSSSQFDRATGVILLGEKISERKKIAKLRRHLRAIYPSNGILWNKNSTRNNYFIQKSWACWWCNFLRSFTWVLDRTNPSSGRVPVMRTKFESFYLWNGWFRMTNSTWNIDLQELSLSYL